MIGKPRDNSPKSSQETLKQGYQKTFNMLWLNSFGGNPPYATALSAETMNSLPALPKLLNKLSGILTEDVYNRFVKSTKSEDKPKKVARDFLKSKRLI